MSKLETSSARDRRGHLPFVHLLWIASMIALLIVLARPGPIVSAGSLDNTGHISGRVLNGSHKNALVANQSVTLQLAENTTARDLITLTTDAQGNYAFSALQTDTSVQYALYTDFQHAQYTSDLIDLSKTADQRVDLTVYDATSSTENIAVVQATLLIDKPNIQAGTLTVSEDYFFENLSTTTYVGQVDASKGRPNALSFSLPTGAKLLALGAGFEGYSGTQVTTGFATNAAVLPGTSRFSFSFQVPYSGDSYHFTYKALYPTVSLLLLTPTSFQTMPRGLEPKGPTTTKTGIYSSYQAQQLSADKSIEAQINGLPAPAKATSQQSTLSPGLIWLIALLIVLMALAGIGGYLYNTRRRRAASTRHRGSAPSREKAATVPQSKKAAPAGSKEALLQEMLALDKAYETRKMKKAVYEEQRARLKARLRSLMSEQPESKPGKTLRASGKGEK